MDSVGAKNRGEKCKYHLPCEIAKEVNRVW